MKTQEFDAPTAVKELDGQVHDALDHQVFEFREVTEVNEVEALLRLRYRVYGACASLRGFIDPDGPPVLMDSYDRFARLFGLFDRTAGASRLIGTLRIVTLDPGPTCMALEMVASGHPSLIRRLRASRRNPLPLIDLLPDSGAIEACVTRAMARGESIVEAGRFAVDPEFRAGRGTGLRLARHMIEITMAQLFLPNGGDHGFITCVPAHVGLYERVGFRTPAGCGQVQVTTVGTELACLHITRDFVVGEVRSRVLARAAELAETGRVVLESDPGVGAWPETNPASAVPRPVTIRRIVPSAIAHPALHMMPAN